jgi:ribosomal protein S18 acetylase RimI-like enzyme
VPRAWALTWLAGAHREAPEETPAGWRERWADEAARFGQAPIPSRFVDEPNAGMPVSELQRLAEAEAAATVELVRAVAIPRLLREAEARGWWRPFDGAAADAPTRASRAAARAPDSSETTTAMAPTIVAAVDASTLSGWTLAPRVVPPLDPGAGHALLLAALSADPSVVVSAALDGATVVGLVLSARARGEAGRRELLAVGVAPAARRAGLAAALLHAHLGNVGGTAPIDALLTVAERDPVDPLPVATRRDVAARLLAGAGFVEGAAPAAIRAVDPSTFVARRDR